MQQSAYPVIHTISLALRLFQNPLKSSPVLNFCASQAAWIVFDEVHYLRDKERGVVWEQAIVLTPPSVNFVFLSATLPNAREFASWIAKIHR